MKKKWMIGVLSATLGITSLGSISPVAVHGQVDRVYIQSEAEKVLDMTIRDGVDWLGFRKLMESRGFEVLWDETTKTVSAQKNGFVVRYPFATGVFDWDGKDRLVDQGAAGWLDANRLYISMTDAERILEAYTQQRPLVRQVRVTIPGVMDQPDIIRTNDEQYAKTLGLTIEVQQTPLQHYRDRLNLMAAAGDMSDLSFIDEKRQLELFVENGIISPLDEALLRSPEWKQYLTQALGDDYAKRPLYGIPVVSEAEGRFPWIHEAWLASAGIEQPETLEELLSALKKMQGAQKAEGHYVLGGYVGGADLGGLQWVEQAFNGQPSRFVEREGQLVDTLFSPETRKALGWLQEAYRDGLIDPEFAVRHERSVIDQLQAGEIGVIGLDWATGAALEGYQPQSFLQTQEGQPVVFTNKRIAGWYVMSLTTNQADMINLLGQALLKDESTLGGQSLRPKGTVSEKIRALDLDETRMDQLLEARQAEVKAMDAKDVLDPADGLVVTRYNHDITQMERDVQQMKIKVIMGVASIEEWMVFVEKLASGDTYKAMREQLHRAYAGTNSNTDQPQSEQLTPITVMVSTPGMTREQFEQLSVLNAYTELGVATQWQHVEAHFAEKLKTMVAAGMPPDVVFVEDEQLYKDLGQTGAFLVGANWRDLETEELVIPEVDSYGIPRFDEDGEPLGWIMISAMSKDLKAIERFLTYSTSGEDDNLQPVFDKMFGFNKR